MTSEMTIGRHTLIETLVGHVETFQKHPHPVVSVLVKGFSRVITRGIFGVTKSDADSMVVVNKAENSNG